MRKPSLLRKASVPRFAKIVARRPAKANADKVSDIARLRECLIQISDLQIEAEILRLNLKDNEDAKYL